MSLTVRRAAVALAAGLLTVLAGAVPAAAGTPLPVRHAVAIIRDPEVKGIVALVTDPSGDGTAYIGGDGFGSDVHPTTIVSHQRCGVAHDPSTGRLGIFSPRDPQSGLPTVVKKRIAGLLPFIEQDARFSVRVFRGDPRRQVACADFVRYGDAGDRPSVAAAPAAYELKDVYISSFKSGLVLHQVRADGIRITASLPAFPTDTGRIVGDDAPCGTPMTGTPPFGIYSNNMGGGLLGILATPSGDPFTTASVRLFKGTGSSRPAGCSSFVAVLAPR